MSKLKKNSIDRKLWFTVIVFLVILVVSVVLLFIVSSSEEASQDADQNIRLSGQAGFTCEYAEAQKLYVFASGVMKITNDRIAYLTLSGNEVYSVSVSYNNPQCFIRDDMCVVFDCDGYGFVVMNDDEVIYEKPTDNRIQSAVLSKSGLCAVITESDDAYGEVILYHTDGSQISRWTSYNSGYPISGAFSDDEQYFALTTLSTTGAVYEPYVRIFSLEYDDDSVDVKDYAVYSIDDTDILAYVNYIGNNLFAFSTDTIYTIKGETLAPLDENFGTINYVKIVDDVIFTVYSDGVEQLNKLRIESSSGSVIYDSEIGSDVNAISTSDSLYAISIDDRIFIFDSKGNIISDSRVDEAIIRIGFTDNNRLVVVSTGGVHTIDY